MSLQPSRHLWFRYWIGTPNQQGHINRVCRRLRIGLAQRERSRSNGERFLAPGYVYVPHAI